MNNRYRSWIKLWLTYLKSYRDRTLVQGKYLSVEDELEEQASHHLVLLAISAIFFIVIAAIIWSSFTTVKEISMATGFVVPQEPVRVLQHLEGGIISKIHIRDGQHVKKNQLLIELDPTANLAEFERTQARKYALLVDAERLRSYTSGKKDLRKLESLIRHSLGKQKDEILLKQLISDEEMQLHYQNQSKIAQQEVILSQINKASDQVNLIEQQKEVLRDHVDLLKKEKEMYDSLMDEEAFSKRDYLKTRRELNSAIGQLKKLYSEEQVAIQELSEYRNRLIQLNLSFEEKTSEKIGAINAELIELERLMVRLKDKVKRMKIFSPTDGIVKGLKWHKGNVISAGGVLTEIVPLTKELLVEVKISTKDIGHVKINDSVKVKVLTYDFSKFGDIPGKLESISPSTYIEEDGIPYYQGIVRLVRHHVGMDPKRHTLIPGMTVQADIVTGERTILQYLLKPIHIGLAKSFSER